MNIVECSMMNMEDRTIATVWELDCSPYILDSAFERSKNCNYTKMD